MKFRKTKDPTICSEANDITRVDDHFIPMSKKALVDLRSVQRRQF